MTNNDSQELTNFLDKYGIKYKVVGYRIVAEEVDLAFRGITQLPDSIYYLQCDNLHLNGNNIASLPNSIWNLKCKSLYLHDNNITHLPYHIGNLQCEYLSLNDNNITSLPVNIGDLQCEYLYLYNNSLTSLPDSFGNLKCKDLYLHNNPLTSESIDLLEKLKSAGVNVKYQPTKQTNIGCKIMTNNDLKELTNFLDNYGVKYEVVENIVVADEAHLSNIGITQLPDSIGNLKCESLFLDGNKLEYLPDNIGNLKCEYLWLDNNNLTQLPESFGNLKCEYLRLHNNELTQLPDRFCNLKCKLLELNNNQLTSLPDSFVDLKCNELYLHNNNLTAESIELLEKMKSNGVTVKYQPTKQTNIGGNIMTNCDNVVDPDHYKKGAFQTIDVIEEFLENESRLLTAKQKYSIGNALKYISRAGLKGSTPEDAITDLKKAENYIHRAITGEWIDAS